MMTGCGKPAVEAEAARPVRALKVGDLMYLQGRDASGDLAAERATSTRSSRKSGIGNGMGLWLRFSTVRLYSVIEPLPRPARSPSSAARSNSFISLARAIPVALVDSGNTHRWEVRSTVDHQTSTRSGPQVDDSPPALCGQQNDRFA